MTGPLNTRIAEDMPVSKSPVPKRLKKCCCRPADLQSTQAQTVSSFAGLTVFKQWKGRVSKRTNDTVSFGYDAEAREIKELEELHRAACHIAFQRENEKARFALRTPALVYCAAEEIDRIFPPSLQYISKAYMEEVSEAIWEELVASRRK